MTDTPANGHGNGRLEKLAESAYGKILNRWVLPGAMLLGGYFLERELEANQEFQKEITRSLQTIQTGLAVTVQQLNSNTANDQRQDRDIEKLEDRVNGT